MYIYRHAICVYIDMYICIYSLYIYTYIVSLNCCTLF